MIRKKDVKVRLKELRTVGPSKYRLADNSNNEFDIIEVISDCLNLIGDVIEDMATQAKTTEDLQKQVDAQQAEIDKLKKESAKIKKVEKVGK